MKRGIHLIILFFISVHGLIAQQFLVQVDTNRMQIGDKVGMNIVVNLSPGQEYGGVELQYLDSLTNELKAEPTEGPSTFEILDSNAWQVNGNTRTQKLTFTIWEEGSYKFPPIPLNFISNGTERQVFSRPFSILVGSPLQSSDVQDSIPLAPIKSIIETPRDLFKDILLPILKILGLFLLVLGLGYFIYRLLSKKKEVIREPFYINPNQIAIHKLNAIQSEKPWEKGDFKTYHSDLTFAIREYLENRFSINALEMTTGEITRSLSSGNIDAQWVDQLKTIFNTADMVKFAKAVPPYDLHKTTLDKCLDFVQTTKNETILIELTEEEEKIYPKEFLKRKPKEVEE